MRLTEVKQLIKEQVAQYQIDILNENIMRDIWSMLLSSKVKRAIDKYKNQPEYKELQRKIKQSTTELEVIAQRLEQTVAEKEALIQKFKKQGYKLEPGMSYKEMYDAVQKEYDKDKSTLPAKYLKDLDKLSK
jgi:C4-dicarboxylate-specific signal transduction histidine kinase